MIEYLLVAAFVLSIYFTKEILTFVKRPDAPLLCAELSRKSRSQRWAEDAEGLLRTAYAEFKQGLPMVRATVEDGTETTILNPRYLNELKTISDDAMTFTGGIEHFFLKEYTGISNVSALGQHAIRSDLTPGLPRLMSTIAQETDVALRGTLPQEEAKWTSLVAYPALLHAVAQVSARLFVGEKLCRSSEWLEISKNFTALSFQASEAIKRWHPWSRPLVHRFIPEIRKLDQERAKAVRLLRTSIEEFSKEKRVEGVQRDYLLGWVERKKPDSLADTTRIVEMQLMMSLAAIHTTTMSLVQILYDLAYRPDYIGPLRDEVEKALEECGDFNKDAMAQFKKIDSFMKESQRTNPPAFTTFRRLLTKDIKLSDGTFIPKGNFIEIDHVHRYEEGEGWADPEHFDGFRFCKLREMRPNEKSSHQFISSNPDYLHWGHGKHACPGRFFAANEIKIILANILMNYDIALPAGVGRPKNIVSGIQVIPDPTAQLLFKKRKMDSKKTTLLSVTAQG